MFVVVLFILTANVRWGIPWSVHLGIFVALEGFLLATGYFGSAARSRRWDEWRAALPFTLKEPSWTTLARSDVGQIWVQPVFRREVPSGVELERALAAAHVPGFRLVRLAQGTAFSYSGPLLLLRPALHRLTDRLFTTLHERFPFMEVVVRPRFDPARVRERSELLRARRVISEQS